MKNYGKKIIVFILCISMFTTLFGLTAFASGMDQTEEVLDKTVQEEGSSEEIVSEEILETDSVSEEDETKSEEKELKSNLPEVSLKYFGAALKNSDLKNDTVFNMDAVPRKNFQLSAFTPDEATSFKSVGGAAGVSGAEVALDILSTVGGDMRCWAVCGMMDTLFGNDQGVDVPEYLTAQAAEQMQNETIAAIEKIGRLEDQGSIAVSINRFKEAMNNKSGRIEGMMKSINAEEVESESPDDPVDPAVTERRLHLLASNEFVNITRIDDIYATLYSAIMTKYSVTFNGVLTDMDLFDAYLASMRNTFPWESEGMESLRTYYNVIANEYALISFLEMLSLDARYQLATDESEKLYLKNIINVTADEIKKVHDRVVEVSETYIADHPYHYFWAPGYTAKFQKLEDTPNGSYKIDIPYTVGDPEFQRTRVYYIRDTDTIVYEGWQRMYTDKGLYNVLDGEGYEQIMQECARYYKYGDRDYPNASIEEILTWGDFGINFNKGEDDLLFFKMTGNGKFPMYTTDGVHHDFNTMIYIRCINADTSVVTALNQDNTSRQTIEFQHDSGGLYDDMDPLRNSNCYVLPIYGDYHFVKTYDELKECLDSAPVKEDGMEAEDYTVNIIVGSDIKGEVGQAPLTVRSGCHINLDLNEHDLSTWNNNDSAEQIHVNGNLSVYNGRITGRYSDNITSGGFFVDSDGELKLENVYFSQFYKEPNDTDDKTHGVPVYVQDGGECSIDHCHFNLICGKAINVNSCKGTFSIKNSAMMLSSDTSMYFRNTKDVELDNITVRAIVSDGISAIDAEISEDSTFTMNNCSITGNIDNKGCVQLIGPGKAILKECEIKSNISQASDSRAQTVYVETGECTLENSKIIGNENTNTATGGAFVSAGSGKITLIGKIEILSNLPYDVWLTKTSDAPFIATKSMDQESIINVCAEVLPAAVGSVPGKGWVDCFGLSFLAKLTTQIVERDGYIYLEKKSSIADIKKELQKMKNNPDAYTQEQMIEMLEVCEIASQDEELHKQMQGDGEYMQLLSDLMAKVKESNHKVDCGKYEVILLGTGAEGKDMPDWKYILSSKTINVPDTIKEKLKKDWVVLVSEDITVSRYGGGDIEGKFTIGFSGKGIERYKNAQAVVYHLLADGTVEELKPTWNEEQKCFTVVTDSFSPFVLAVKADSGVSTGDDSNIFLYGLATILALLGAGYVYRLRRKEEK